MVSLENIMFTNSAKKKKNCRNEGKLLHYELLHYSTEIGRSMCIYRQVNAIKYSKQIPIPLEFSCMRIMEISHSCKLLSPSVVYENAYWIQKLLSNYEMMTHIILL